MKKAESETHIDRVAGSLLGLAIGDALGLPYEGLPHATCERRWKRPLRYRLFGKRGFVSDDTEQSALVAQAITKHPDDPALAAKAFRRSMVGWFARLPFGIGFGTLRACLKMMFGFRNPGVRSAGNGAAMRAGVIGAVFARNADMREEMVRQISELTHTDPRAVEAAAFVAEVTANASLTLGPLQPDSIIDRSRSVLSAPELTSAVFEARRLAAEQASLARAVKVLGNSGFVVHSLGICSYCFIRADGDPVRAIELAIRAGGDTDTHAAIVGGWAFSHAGTGRIPAPLTERLQNGPFGRVHLLGLAEAAAGNAVPPRWSWPHALARNLALYPVVLAHGFSRLLFR